MIEPALKDQAFLASVRHARHDAESFHLWWLGQSGFLIQWQGRHLLIDPYLSDSLTQKYAQTDKPHVRMTARVVDPAKLDFIDVVTSSHAHTDHLDGATLVPIFAANPELVVVAPESIRGLAAERIGVAPERIRGLDDGQKVAAAGFEVHAVPAAHETLERDEAGRCRALGYVFRFGRWSVYHSGDTVRYDGMAERLRPFAIDLALLPINGRAPERRVAGNLDGAEAAQLAADIGARFVIPCHFEMFAFNTASPDVFVAECARLGQRFRVLRGGEAWSGREIGGA
jgi:L-ascorbate metabolism protein UlaG (beta-lactamase superfamily)